MAHIKVELKLNSNVAETKLTIETNEITQKVQDILDIAKEDRINTVVAYRASRVYLLDFKKIESVYSQKQKVYVRTQKGEIYTVKYRLYQMEELLANYFVRISVSEIINTKTIDHLDLSLAGTIEVVFCSGIKTHVSRRYLSKVKEALNI